MSKSRHHYDFKALGQAIKSARMAAGMTRDELGDKLHLAPRYIVSIENEGQHPSLQVLYELVTLFNISVDQFFFDEKPKRSTLRQQVDGLIDSIPERDLPIIEATARGIIRFLLIRIFLKEIVRFCFEKQNLMKQEQKRRNKKPPLLFLLKYCINCALFIKHQFSFFCFFL